MKANEIIEIKKINELKLILLRVFVFFGDYEVLHSFTKKISVNRLKFFVDDLKKMRDLCNTLIAELELLIEKDRK